MRRKIIAICIACFFLACFGIQSGSAQGTSPSLTGSWQLTLVPNTLPTFQVAGLANFTSDGGAVATASAILAGTGDIASTSPVSSPTPAIGNWNDGGAANRAVFKVLSIITNPDGSLFATRTFIADGISSTGSSFTGSYSYQVVDTSNNTIASGSGTISGTLIPHFLPPAD